MSRRLSLLIACVALSGCGAERQSAPDPFAVVAPSGSVAESVRAGSLELRFRRPRNWSGSREQPPRAFTLRSGEAIVVGWVYRRTEPLPGRGPALEQARQSLADELGRRDPSFELSDSRVLEVAGAPAVEVTGTETVSKRKRRVRSVHVYTAGSEIVLEAVAPLRQFAEVNRGVLEPLLRSLRVTELGE